MVDEKVAYLLSRDYSLSCENEEYVKKVKDVLGKHFQYQLSGLGYEASNKGIAWLQAYADLEGNFKTMIIPSNIYRMKDRPVLPLHSNCRCTYIPVIDKEETKSDHDTAKEEINNEFNRRKNIGYKYTEDGIIMVTEDHKGEHFSVPKIYKPYAVIETDSIKNGVRQIDRTIYNKDGKMIKQIHSGPHDRLDLHPYGNNGEHMHSYKWDGNKIIDRKTKNVTAKDRKLHKDILK
ncbi:phage portal protein [Clostridium cadaveris]|uniref:phage portal protein n=1 Tax=Clostridium cadaveris TaxID=1529 RepID=UPI0039964E0B